MFRAKQSFQMMWFRALSQGFLTLGVALLFVGIHPASAQEYATGKLIIKMKGQTSFQAMNQGRHQKSGESLQLQRSWHGINMHEVRLKAGQDVDALMSALAEDPDVEYVEPDYYLYKQSFEVEPNSRMNLSEMQQGEVSVMGLNTDYVQSQAYIQMEEAWNILSNFSDDVVVAVIDSGVDYNHEVFQRTDSIWRNTMELPGGVDRDGNGYPGDVRGWNFVSDNASPLDDSDHGTHVAGIILGAEQNIFDPNPKPSRIKIMPLKFLDAQGRGATSDAIQAIFYAVNNGAHVINASWGGGGYSQSLLDAIKYAHENDVLFVAAAGNQASNNDQTATYPASYSAPNLLSVAASNDFDYLASFSNYGKSSVLLSSPGQSILSTLPGNSTGRMSGTSMAAPLAAGIAALMIFENPSITPHQIRGVLGDTSDMFYQLEPYVRTGRINALSGIQYAKSGDLSLYEKHPHLDSPYRSVASDIAGGSGCAASPLILGMAEKFFGGGSGPSWPAQLGALFALLSPLLVLLALRAVLKSMQRTRRRYERYQIMTDVVIKAGDREFRGSVSSLSMGGVRVDTNALLEDGGQVQMKILSPDGTHELEVSGEIVWSEKEKAYGVAFSEIGRALKQEIAEWQKTLTKAST